MTIGTCTDWVNDAKARAALQEQPAALPFRRSPLQGPVREPRDARACQGGVNGDDWCGEGGRERS
jgi:hypothetical protein